MHLYANSMNILGKLQTLPTLNQTGAKRPAGVPRALTRRSFEFHFLGGDGSMAGQWDGDARRQPGGRNFHADVPVRVEEEEVEVVDPATFWG